MNFSSPNGFINQSPKVSNRIKTIDDDCLSVRMISGRLNNTTVITPDIVSLNLNNTTTNNNNENSIGSIVTPISPNMTPHSSKTTQNFLDFRKMRQKTAKGRTPMSNDKIKIANYGTINKRNESTKI